MWLPSYFSCERMHFLLSPFVIPEWWTPKENHILIPQPVYMLQDKGELRLLRELWLLSWPYEDYPGLPGEPRLSHRFLEPQESVWEWYNAEQTQPAIASWKDGRGRSQRKQESSRDWKRQENGFSPKDVSPNIKYMVSFPASVLQLSDTRWVSKNLIQFWHQLLEIS